MLRLLNKPGLASSLNQIDIKSVRDDVLILRDRRYCLVLQTSSINFELKSEAEQDVLIETYRNFLNSLDSPIQIIIRTREVDLDSYVDNLLTRLENEKVDIYQRQITSYADFIKGLVKVNRILSRSFYLVIQVSLSSKEDFSLAKEQLAIKKDIVLKGLQRMGMQVNSLNSLEILNLFYEVYNPRQAKLQPLSHSAIKMMNSIINPPIKDLYEL